MDKVIICNNYNDLKISEKILSEKIHKIYDIENLKQYEKTYFPLSIMITNYKTAYDIEICGNCLKCGANVCHVIEKGKIITYDKYIREEKLNRILND